jgi:hypothetical protein
LVFGGILIYGGNLMPALRLKNPRAYELAEELARLTRETLTAAVITARSARLVEERGRRRRADEMLAFAAKFAPGIAAGITSAGHTGLFDAEGGMPR